MYSKLTVLGLFTVLISAVSGILKWEIPEEQINMLKAVKDKEGATPFAQGKLIGVEHFKDNVALVIIEFSKTNFQTYQLNLETKSIEALRCGASTLKKMRKTADMYAKMNFISSLDEKDIAEHRLQLTRKGLFNVKNLWEIEAGDDKAMAKKCVALVAFDDGCFGFAPYIYSKVCNSDGKISSDTSDFIVLGYSQKCESEAVAKESLFAYLCHDASFGEIPWLPALYSGAESLAMVAFVGKTQEIRDLIPKFYVDNYKVLRAWSVANHTKCIAIFMSTIYGYYQYNYVICESSKSGSEIQLKAILRIGNRVESEFASMMGLVDYLKRNYLSDEFEKVEKTASSAVAELIFAADFCGRKLLAVSCHRDKEDVASLNRSIDFAYRVSKKLKSPTSAVSAGILLYDLPFGVATINEIELVMRSKVQSVIDHIREFGSDLIPAKGPVKDVNGVIFNMFEFPTFPTTSMVEGSKMNAPESVLVKLLKERRKKAYIRDNITTDPPMFLISFEEGKEYQNTIEGVYQLIECTEEMKRFSVHVTITDQYETNPSVVVGELQYNIHNCLLGFEKKIKMPDAYKKVLENTKGTLLTANDTNDYVVKLMACLDYAARKHVYTGRDDNQRTPYINHVIGVARIIVEEGGIDGVDLVMAAILHDTLNHTTATKEELELIFGKQITEIVVDVSRILNERSYDKELQIEIDRTLSPAAVLVRLADRIYNLRDLDRQCPRDYPEAKRRWQFTSKTDLVCSLETNYTNNSNWDHNIEYKSVFTKLLGVLKSIIASHQKSLVTTLDLTKLTNGIHG